MIDDSSDALQDIRISCLDGQGIKYAPSAI